MIGECDNLVRGAEPFWAAPDGRAALYLGDALRILSGLPDESIDCVWTDPPYKLSNGGITCVAGRMVSVDKGTWDKSGGLDADHQFNLHWTRECRRVLKPAGTIWVSGTLHVYPSVGMALLRNGFRLLNDIVWEKPNPPPNLGCRTFVHSTELVLWATKAAKNSRHKYTFNYEDMRRENGGKQMKTVWQFTPAGKDEKRYGKHPTQKPVALIERCLRASTHPGDLVLDPFAGSGSTGIAALKTSRRFIGIEVDSNYAAIGATRLSKATYSPPPTMQTAKPTSRIGMAHRILPGCAKKGPAESWPRAIREPAKSWSAWSSPRWSGVAIRSGDRCTSGPASASRSTR